ncbi:MAG: hypothetical protein FJY83_01360 [Candidatus Aminicenantes bacterium]|nr:hypothetical protein [Candidatus Aminicenantes bacterium]
MAPDRVKVVIKVKTSSPLFRVSIDEKRVLLRDGAAKVDLASGSGEHVLMWLVRDRPGASYGIEIAEPPRAKMSCKAALDASGMDAGIFWFTL